MTEPVIILPDEDLRIAAELKRKYLEQLDRLVAAHEAHEISDREFKIGWRSVYHVVSGLVDWDTVNDMEAGYQAHIAQLKPASRAAVKKSTSMGTAHRNVPSSPTHKNPARKSA